MPGNTVSVRRTAYEIKRYRLWTRVLALFAFSVALLLILGYVVSVLYTKFGAFTVTVNKFDNLDYALTLSETPDFLVKTARLNADAEQEITNIDGSSLPEGLDNINGKHNGENYVAYTFYCRNEGTRVIDYTYELYIANMTSEIEKAVRVRLYVNGEYKTYAYPRTDGGSGPEPGTIEFYTGNTIAKDTLRDFAPGDYDKYTVVIWLEGNDPDCIDKILGGKFKVDMTFAVITEAGTLREGAA